MPLGDLSRPVGQARLAAGRYATASLGWDDERHVGALLARAFVDDPLVIAICHAPAAARRSRMEWGFRVAVRNHYLAAQPAWTLADSSACPLGVALVTSSPPVRQKGPSDPVFVLRAFLHVRPHTALRGLKAARVIASQAPTVPFTYLRTLGVDPAFQGRGLGSQLVEQVVRAASPLLPIYLETANERNLSFYARHGFACIGEFRCLGVPVWRMLRAATDATPR
ncbi:MAG: GNAT family N-acetyltransferase [Candidatus Binatia bacterium]